MDITDFIDFQLFFHFNRKSPTWRFFLIFLILMLLIYLFIKIANTAQFYS